MTDTNNFVITAQYLEHKKTWLKWLKYCDSVAVTFPYLNDRPLRVQQFAQELMLEKNINPIIFDPPSHAIDEQADLEAYIQKGSVKNKVNVLIIDHGDDLFLPQNIKFLEYLQVYRAKNLSNFTTFITFECNLTHKLNSFHVYDLLFQNHDYYPLYNEIDVVTFINFIAAKWNLNISTKKIKQIASASSGSFWLAKEAARIYRDTGDFDTNNPNFLTRTLSIAKYLNSREQEILIHTPKLSKYTQGSDYNHLKSTGFITEKDECRIASLIKPIHGIYNSEHFLNIHDNAIYLDKLNISMTLSKQENIILMGLMKKPNTPFSRDELATILWPEDTEEKFSSWAIDQATKRLRDKLVAFGLPPATIRSVRGIGYEYRN